MAETNSSDQKLESFEIVNSILWKFFYANDWSETTELSVELEGLFKKLTRVEKKSLSKAIVIAIHSVLRINHKKNIMERAFVGFGRVLEKIFLRQKDDEELIDLRDCFHKDGTTNSLLSDIFDLWNHEIYPLILPNYNAFPAILTGTHKKDGIKTFKKFYREDLITELNVEVKHLVHGMHLKDFLKILTNDLSGRGLTLKGRRNENFYGPSLIWFGIVSGELPAKNRYGEVMLITKLNVISAGKQFSPLGTRIYKSEFSDAVLLHDADWSAKQLTINDNIFAEWNHVKLGTDKFYHPEIALLEDSFSFNSDEITVTFVNHNTDDDICVPQKRGRKGYKSCEGTTKEDSRKNFAGMLMDQNFSANKLSQIKKYFSEEDRKYIEQEMEQLENEEGDQ